MNNYKTQQGTRRSASEALEQVLKALSRSSTFKLECLKDLDFSALLPTRENAASFFDRLEELSLRGIVRYAEELVGLIRDSPALRRLHVDRTYSPRSHELMLLGAVKHN